MDKTEKDYVVKDTTLAQTIKELAQDTWSQPPTRFTTFLKFAGVLKSIKNKHDFLSAQHLYWSEILAHHKEWMGDLFVPDYYRRQKDKANYPDIRYSIKEAWAWGMLYPEEAQQYFEQGDNGFIGYSAKNPKVRLMDKEIITTSTRNEVGSISYFYKKPFPHQMLKNGFLYEQTQWITEYLTVGLFTFEARVVPKAEKTKTPKKVSATTQKNKTSTTSVSYKPSASESFKAQPPAQISKAKSDAIAQVRSELGLGPINTQNYHSGYTSENREFHERVGRVEEQSPTDYLDYQIEPEYSSEDLDDALIVPAPWKTRSSNKDKKVSNSETKKKQNSKTLASTDKTTKLVAPQKTPKATEKAKILSTNVSTKSATKKKIKK